MNDVLLRHPNFKAGFHQVPKYFGNPNGMPVPDIISRTQIRVPLQQTGWELFSEPHRESPHDGRIRTGKLASFGGGARDARRTFADVLTTNDEEGLIKVVNFYWAAADAASVLERAPARSTMDTSEDER